MSKAMRGYGCVMKRQKKNNGGAMRPMPENLKEYLPEWEYPKEDVTPKNKNRKKTNSLKILANKKIKDEKTGKGMYLHKDKTKKGDE